MDINLGKLQELGKNSLTFQFFSFLRNEMKYEMKTVLFIYFLHTVGNIKIVETRNLSILRKLEKEN